MLGGQPTFQVRPGVDAWGGVALDEDVVTAARMILAAEEVVEPHLVQAGGALVRRYMAADFKTLAVGLADHDRRVPADESANPPFDMLITWEPGLGFRRDRVDVVTATQCRQTDLTRPGSLQQLEHDEPRAVASLVLEQAVERLQPVGSLIGIDIGKLAGQSFGGDSRMRSWRSHLQAPYVSSSTGRGWRAGRSVATPILSLPFDQLHPARCSKQGDGPHRGGSPWGNPLPSSLLGDGGACRLARPPVSGRRSAVGLRHPLSLMTPWGYAAQRASGRLCPRSSPRTEFIASVLAEAGRKGGGTPQ